VETDLYPYMPTYVYTPRPIPRTAHLSRYVCGVPFLMKLYFAVDGRFVKFLASGEAVPRNKIFPAQDAPKPPCKTWRR